MQAWRSRFEEHGPRWLSWLLAGLIVFDGATAIFPRAHGQPAPSPAAAANRPATRRTPLDWRLIEKAHLFGVPVTNSNRDPEVSVPTTANLTLHGTFATRDPRHGMAIIAADNEQKLYRIGDQADGLALYSVYSDHVMLDHSGQLESLSLPHGVDNLHLASAVRQAEGAAGLADPEGHRLAEVMRAEPSVNEDSQRLIGFRISPIPPNARFVRAGLRPGDLVTAINGTPLADQDPQQSQKVMDSALATGNASVSLLRNGKHVEVSIDLGP